MSYGWLAESGIRVSSSRSASVISRSAVGGERRRLVEVVRRQVRQQRLDVVDRVVLVGGEVVRVAAAGVVRAGPAQLLHRHVLAGHRLDHVRSGDEHVRGLVDHHGEVGDRGGVDRAARARPHHQRDLRDHPGGADVAEEDLPVEAETDHALLDPGAAGVVDPHHRAADLHRQVHHLDDLLAEDLAERAAEDGEVLGEDADLAAVDGAVAGDHAVAVRAGAVQPEVGRPVPGQLVQLDEGTGVEQQLDPLAGGLLAPGVLLLDRAGGAGVHRLVHPPLQIRQLAGGAVDVDLDLAARAHGGICLSSRLQAQFWIVTMRRPAVAGRRGGLGLGHPSGFTHGLWPARRPPPAGRP